MHILPNIDPNLIERKGERDFLNILNKDPRTSDWICFHAFRLPGIGNQRECEIDFILLIPFVGVIVVEIKDGNIYINDKGFYVYSGKEHTRPPLTQLHDNFFALNNFLKLKTNIRIFEKIAHAYALICRDCYSPEKNALVEEYIYDKSDKIKKVDYVDFVLKLTHANQTQIKLEVPNIITINQIKDALYNENCNRGSFLADDIAEISSRIENLTHTQEELLTSMLENYRLLIDGGFGTGKTLLAIKAIEEFKKQNLKIALVVFNRLICASLKEKFINDENVTVFAIQDYATEMLLQNGRVDLNTVADETKFYREFYHDAVEKNFDIFVPTFDIVIGDESQDFLIEQNLHILDRILINGLKNGRWIFLGDFKYQKVYEHSVDLPSLKELFETKVDVKQGTYTNWKLTTNCRNNPEIIEEINRICHPHQEEKSLLEQGRKNIQYITFDPNIENDQISKIESQIDKLIDGGVAKNKITILTRNLWNNEYPYPLMESFTKYKVIHYVNKDGQNITHASFRRFKGLENDVIIIPDVSSYKDEQFLRRFVVAISRARAKLIIFETNEACEERYSYLYPSEINY